MSRIWTHGLMTQLYLMKKYQLKKTPWSEVEHHSQINVLITSKTTWIESVNTDWFNVVYNLNLSLLISFFSPPPHFFFFATIYTFLAEYEITQRIKEKVWTYE